uniref:Uncharacterized protein n=1 Tax=Oryza sativa subsp. japonica TaxID=39947 RepID=Q6K528_ORYSJ|nr:hypothetical protein [Oryza sativa Japonica Group]BAD28203.1 hypothetical protein [Oryza sativa Japonica Group]
MADIRSSGPGGGDFRGSVEAGGKGRDDLGDFWMGASSSPSVIVPSMASTSPRRWEVASRGPPGDRDSAQAWASAGGDDGSHRDVIDITAGLR